MFSLLFALLFQWQAMLFRHLQGNRLSSTHSVSQVDWKYTLAQCLIYGVHYTSIMYALNYRIYIFRWFSCSYWKRLKKRKNGHPNITIQLWWVFYLHDGVLVRPYETATNSRTRKGRYIFIHSKSHTSRVLKIIPLIWNCRSRP